MISSAVELDSEPTELLLLKLHENNRLQSRLRREKTLVRRRRRLTLSSIPPHRDGTGDNEDIRRFFGGG
uniref:Uncharacterized protein n=1 Tax=Octopus bimaculoides TaxID=37653 RepID=A0A0L8FNY2_OCTBM